MQNLTKQTLEIYWQHIKKYPKAIILAIFGVTIASITNVLSPLFFKNFFDVLSQHLPSNTNDYFILVQILIIIAIIEFIGWAAWRITDFSASFFQSHIIRDLSDTCFAYLHKHSTTFFHNNFVGSLTKRVNRFTRAFESLSDRFIYNILQMVLNIAGITMVLFFKDWRMGLGLTVWIVIFMAINWWFVNFKLPYDIERSKADTATTGVLADTITNQINVKLFGGYEREKKRYSKTTEKLRYLRQLTWYMGSTFFAVQGLLTLVLEIGLLFLGLYFWKLGKFTVGDFVLIQSYTIIVLLRLWDVGRIIQHIYEDLSEAREMTEIFLTEYEITDPLNAKKLKVTNGQIEFNDVSFYYHSTRPILKNFNLNIKPLEKVALVGPSGAGKSTIVKLLLRLHDLSEGEIKIDGQPINKVTLNSLWNTVSLVPQDPILFHRSLADNISYGHPEAKLKDIIKAAKLAHCHEFINGFPEKYDTFVGERGIKLSGGERQRVAIARAILHNAPILVLDEATSSLDSESEKLIQDALLNLIKGKTVVVIAHRLSTIMKMDRIIVVANGKIVEEGTHKKLLKKKGLYSRHWQVQAGGFA